jgi:hypothetical protein
MPMPMPMGFGWAWVGISFVHPCIELQIRVKLLVCREYANQEALWAEANDNELSQPLLVFLHLAQSLSNSSKCPER